jgi:hypothetical protein
VEHHGKHEHGEQRGPDDVRSEHQPATVEPVGERVGRQCEQQPRSVKANVSPAINTGDRVKPMAAKGRATLSTPSARFDRAAEVHIRQ